MHASSMCPCEDLPHVGGGFRLFVFCQIFRQLRFFGKCGPPLAQKPFRRKKKEKKKKTVVRTSGWTCIEHVQNFRVLSLKNGVGIRTFVRINEQDTLFPSNNLVLVQHPVLLLAAQHLLNTVSDLRFFARKYLQTCLGVRPTGSCKMRRNLVICPRLAKA